MPQWFNDAKKTKIANSAIIAKISNFGNNVKIAEFAKIE